MIPARRPSAWMADVLGVFLIALHVVLFTVHTDRSARAFDACVVNAPAGLTAPRFFLDNDSYAWLAHARELMASGDWRIRHTSMDNAPFGRDLHWSHPLLWGIRGLATLFMRWNDWPLARALDLAGVWIMPAFQFLILSLIFCQFRRKLGWGAAGLFILLCLALEPLASIFHPLAPDHHGLQAFTAFLSFCSLYFGGMGWVRTGAPADAAGSPLRAFLPLQVPLPAEARRWFAAAGFFCAAGLWLGATVWMFAFAITAACALAVLPFWRAAPPPETRYIPALWRTWAWVGVLFAAAFYLLEYAPRHMAMRLEVNHPIYWLCWLGTAECLVFAARAAALRFWKNRRPLEWILLGFGLGAALSAPLLVLFGPTEWHLMRHPILFRMSDLFTEECKPGLVLMLQARWAFLLPAFGVLPLAAGTLWIRRPVTAFCAWRSFAPVLFTLLFALLFLRQLRWLPFFVLPLAAGTVLWVGQGLARRQSDLLGRILCGALLINVLLADGCRWQTEVRTARADRPPEKWGLALAAKHTALRIGLAAGTNTWRMLGTFDDAPKLYYFTGIPSAASFYWENLEGWQTEAAFYGDDGNGETARAIAEERGLTHALALPAPHRRCVFTFSSLLAPALQSERTLAQRMADPDAIPPLPAWMRKDLPLSAMLSDRILIRSGKDYLHLQNSAVVYSLEPASRRN